MPKKKVDPNMLGSGLASDAAKALQGRNSRLEELEAEAMGEEPVKADKKKKKKKRYPWLSE